MSKLQEMRKKRMLSQNDLVNASGVSRTSILKYESGEKDINRAAGITLYKLATVLSCNVEELLENLEDETLYVLQNMYKLWRKTGERESKNTDLTFTWDAGESSAREDFSCFWKLDYEIDFEKMLELERSYE